ncbi:TetR/AcrR family transcriptional regulator [Allonocardiopsis opalescens]|uniref:TetR family transcriptional regulator n=1 Tax=Allonocardiopsis opalescens TaxID=1144618 RepID=A0A2T0QFQ9_9ACTN|nr:TetR/AcrR family transcriptional regulator [Allonocardiopsis opalescens]PRY02681.1 TetR family transcriptional regulator [Allonocardiopsis opalescens]
MSAGGAVGRPRDPATDRAILAAALDLFTERGVDGTTIEGVAKRAGTTRLSVYRRWAGKEELLLGALEYARTQAPADAAEIRRMSLAQALDSTVELMERHSTQRLVAQLVAAAETHPELLRRYWDGVVVERRAALAAVIRRESAAAAPDRGTDPELVLDLLFGALLYNLMFRPGPRAPGEVRAYLRAAARQAGLLVPERPGADG